MENKKGSGIFLGVVAVATLVVAIIGATFAYFSITAQSAENAVNLTAYEFNASLTVEQVYPASGATYKGLIPLNPNTAITNYTAGALGSNGTNLLYAINEATTKCVDSAGYQVCAVYKLTFVNSGSENMTLDGTLKTNSNEPASQESSAFTDLKLVYGDDDGNVSGRIDTDTVNGQIYSVPTSATDGSNTVSIGSVTVPSGGSDYVKYVIVYLNENGDQSSQMGASYGGQLIFASATAGNQLTGTFTIAAPEQGGGGGQ